MNCWRWAGVIFDEAEAFNVVGTIGIAAAGAASGWWMAKAPGEALKGRRPLASP
jgi:hypothetical protein